MSKKGALGHVNDAVNTAKAIKDIIQGAMKGGVQGAAIAAVKHYWHKLIPIAVIALLLPVIIFISLPAILFDSMFSGEGRSKEEIMTDYYKSYETIRERQVEELKLITFGYSEGKVEYANDKSTFTAEWLVAIDSVRSENDINNTNIGEAEKILNMSYTYEILTPSENDSPGPAPPPDHSAEPLPTKVSTKVSAKVSATSDKLNTPLYSEAQSLQHLSLRLGSSLSPTPSSSPVQSPSPTPGGNKPETEDNTVEEKTIIITVLTPNEVMKKLGFDSDHVEWAYAMHEGYVKSQQDSQTE